MNILIALLAILGSLGLQGQILHYRFTGTVEGNDPNLDFRSEDLVLAGLRIEPGKKIAGSVKFDPEGGITVDGALMPPSNRIYSGGMLEYELRIDGEPFLANSGRSQMDVGIFNDVEDHPGGLEYPLVKEGSDAMILAAWGRQARVVEPTERFSFLLNFTDTSGDVLRVPVIPDSIDLSQFDLAKGFIRPWSLVEMAPDHGAMFQIDTFEFVETLPRPVIASGPRSQIVEAGDSLYLGMREAAGNSGVASQWSLNGVDFPGEIHSGLTLSDLQPKDSGTYRVTAWNNLGTTNVTLARIQVSGGKHRLKPLELSGWNADVILGAGEEVSEHLSFDGESGKWFIAEYLGHPDGFPVSGNFSSAGNADVLYALRPYDQVNALWLTDDDVVEGVSGQNGLSSSGVLDLVRPRKFASLAIAASSSGSGGKGELVLHFADGSISERIDYEAAAWGTSPERSETKAIAGLGRFNGADGQDSYESPNHYGFGLYETHIDLVSLGLAGKIITAIEFHKPLDARTTGVFAISGQSVELEMGVHVSWPAEGANLILDVGMSPIGPWETVGTDIQVDGGRSYIDLRENRIPRFYRSTPADLDRNLVAHYDFGREGRARYGKSDEVVATSDISFADQTMLLTGRAGSQARAQVALLNYNNFTVSLDFLTDERTSSETENILIGGIHFRWIRIFTVDGKLALGLNNDEIVEVFENVNLEPGQWHRLICSINIRSEFAELMLDGVTLPSVALGERFRYDLASMNAIDWQRSLVFGDVGEVTSFAGAIDNLMVFRRALSEEDMRRVHTSLEPHAVTVELGQSASASGELNAGFHVSWEANLAGYLLERATAPIGPWTTVQPLKSLFDGRHLSIMNTEGKMGIYRLRNLR